VRLETRGSQSVPRAIDSEAVVLGTVIVFPDQLAVVRTSGLQPEQMFRADQQRILSSAYSPFRRPRVAPERAHLNALAAEFPPLRAARQEAAMARPTRPPTPAAPRADVLIEDILRPLTVRAAREERERDATAWDRLPDAGTHEVSAGPIGAPDVATNRDPGDRAALGRRATSSP
jgi:hypothetical protein